MQWKLSNCFGVVVFFTSSKFYFQSMTNFLFSWYDQLRCSLNNCVVLDAKECVLVHAMLSFPVWYCAHTCNIYVSHVKMVCDFHMYCPFKVLLFVNTNGIYGGTYWLSTYVNDYYSKSSLGACLAWSVHHRPLVALLIRHIGVGTRMLRRVPHRP